MGVVAHRIGHRKLRAQHRCVNAFPLQIPPGTMAAQRLMGGMAVAAAVVLSIWLLVAAGLQREGTLGGSVPAPLPEAPSIIEADVPVSGIETAPAPGTDIAAR